MLAGEADLIGAIKMSESVKFVVSILVDVLISGLIIGIDLLYRRKVIKRQMRCRNEKFF